MCQLANDAFDCAIGRAFGCVYPILPLLQRSIGMPSLSRLVMHLLLL